MQSLIAPHLLKHLLFEKRTHEKVRPVYQLALFLGVGTLALSGPTWKKEPSPFAQDNSGLVIVLKVTPSMLAQDIQPSRLERATQKVNDLLNQRLGAKTALVAYGGSAHLVIPFTVDPHVIDLFSQALHPDVMPQPGDKVAEGVQLAASLIRKSSVSGSILLIADQVAEDQLLELKQVTQDENIPVHLYGVAAGQEVVVPPGSQPAPPLDKAIMQQAANAVGGKLTLVSPDDLDVQQLSAQIETSLSNVEQDQGDRWQDMGYWLLPVICITALFFFRRGWVVEYG